MRDGDVLGLHEYFSTNGAQDGWRWLAGRYLQCPWQGPIVIGECGVNAAVAGPGIEHYGFHGLGNGNLEVAAAKYLEYLRWYDEQLALDWRIQSAMMFTYDFSHPWETFDIRREQFMSPFLAYVASVGGTAAFTPAPIPTPIPVPIPTPVPDGVWGQAALSPWYALCKRYGDLYGLSPEIVGTTIMVESGGKESIISSAGAVGLMQVMPREAGQAFADRPTRAELFDPETNVEWGCKILSGYRASNSGSLERGLAGYYGGGHAAEDLGSAASVTYLTLWVKWWLRLWKTELPFGTTAPASDNTAVRWNAEEAVRAIEAVRTRLLDNVIAPLYGKG
jgi:hypothetical protein